MKQIICSGGEIALCDDEDYPVLIRHSWGLHIGAKTSLCGYYTKHHGGKQENHHDA